MELTVKLFSPHEGQRKVIEGFADSGHKFGVVSTGRQYGKSLLASNLLVYWLLNNNGARGGWVSPIYGQAKKVYKEIVKACNDVITAHNGSDLIITFANDSTIQFLSAERYDSIRGFSFNYLVVDEAAFVRKEAMQEAILPTLTAIGKKCLIISTPKGRGNWFYEYWMKGASENGDYVSFEGLSRENPYADQAFILEQAKSLPYDIYQQEYEAKFVDGGNDVFTNLDLTCILDGWPARSGNQRYYFGIDTGLSQDSSVLVILSEAGVLHSLVRTNGESIRDIGRKFSMEIKQYGTISGYVETNGIGQAMFEEVRRESRTARPFVTTNDSKVRMIRGLIQDMQEGVLQLPSKKLSSELYQELASYTYSLGENGRIRFSHPPGGHDDIIMALAMANQARNELKGGGASKIYVGNQQQYTSARFG